ncbi:4-(cytidine 5'-diphospho)-2-C-methyl-D-erythritol kinase [soil metagenome]
MTLRIRTPAKLNLGLEVLGRRPDGFHELATIFQAVDVYDELHLTPGAAFSYISDPDVPPEDDIARPILEGAAVELGWTSPLRLVKRIPISAGLGGGSSDAALAIRLRAAGLDRSPLIKEAARIGADVPFFLHGGTTIATGIGSRLTPLPTPRLWFVVHTPDVYVERKTAMLFQGLESTDFTAGSTISEIARILQTEPETFPDTLPNAFERQMLEIPVVAKARRLLFDLAGRVALTGAGPSVYSWHHSPEKARAIGSAMVDAAGGKTLVCATIPEHDDQDELVAFHRELVRGAPE